MGHFPSHGLVDKSISYDVPDIFPLALFDAGKNLNDTSHLLLIFFSTSFFAVVIFGFEPLC
jgi:hypothetical protein